MRNFNKQKQRDPHVLIETQKDNETVCFEEKGNSESGSGRERDMREMTSSPRREVNGNASGDNMCSEEKRKKVHASGGCSRRAYRKSIAVV